eukprot:7038345-Alexandrium_andersonii.AAC.1
MNGTPRQGRSIINGWPGVEKPRAQRTLEKDPRRPTTLEFSSTKGAPTRAGSRLLAAISPSGEPGQSDAQGL